MHNKQQFQNLLSSTISRAAMLALAIVSVLALILIFTQPAQAQTFNVIYNFTGGPDGANPEAGVTIAGAGNLYGTAANGGNSGGSCAPDGCGTVYELKRSGSGWVFNPLYIFSGKDGDGPAARVIFGPDGILYGTTAQGGGCGGSGCGTVFNLKPPPTVCKTALCPWTETVLHSFAGSPDGYQPGYGDLTFDQAGDLYGTTVYGGYVDLDFCVHGFTLGCGTVFELSPSSGGWKETVIFYFRGYGPQDGNQPYAGVILDSDGNLYGTTAYSDGYVNLTGTAYELTPSGSGWTKTRTYYFEEEGRAGIEPIGGLIFDRQGNLYGTTSESGTVFELLPASGGWTLNVLWTFSDFYGSFASLIMDASGNIYGTTTYGIGTEIYGNVFKLSPSNGGWTYTSLHDFTGGSDGGYPYGSVTLGANGNIYGTAAGGGAYGYGVVFEITP